MLKCIILGIFIERISLRGRPSCFVIMYSASISLAVIGYPKRGYTDVLPSKKSFIFLAKNTGSVCSDATAIRGALSLPVNGLSFNISSLDKIVLSDSSVAIFSLYVLPTLSTVSGVI